MHEIEESESQFPPLGIEDGTLFKLAGGETVRRKDLEAEFAVSDKTLKRDLTAMKAKGLALPQGNGSDHTWMAGPALKSRSGTPAA